MRRLTHVVHVTLLLLFASHSRIDAQVLNQDSRGQTAVLSPGGWLAINAGDTSASASYIRLVSTKDMVWGGKVKGKSADGLTPIITQGHFAPGFETSAYLGRKVGTRKKWIAAGHASWNREKITLVDVASVFADQVKKDSFTGWDVGAQLSGPTMLGSWPGIAAISAGVRRTHNYADLSSITLENARPVGTGADGTVRRSIETINGRTGEYRTGTGPAIDADYVMQIASTRFVLHGLLRTVAGANDMIDATRLGVDVGFLKTHGDLARDRLLGMTFEVGDVFTQRPKAGPMSKRFRAALVVTLPIPGVL